jgi:hypothetical protein
MEPGAARKRMEFERRFVEERGGQRWRETYILPFYRTWMGYSARRGEAQGLIPDLRKRSTELSVEDISAMVGMQWRIQVMGAWFAIARSDDVFRKPVHDAFEVCFGMLTAPALATAALTYPSIETVDVLRRYRERDVSQQYGSAGIITAALRRLDGGVDLEDRTSDDEALDALLDVARLLRAADGA